MQLPALDTAIVVAYLLGMLGVGLWVSRRIGGFKDFFVAGGRMTTPILVCTLVSTYYGLDVTFGTSETAYKEGVAAFFAYSAPFYVAYLAMALLVAPRLRRIPALSLPEAMGHFYGRGARLGGAFGSFVYSAPILGVSGMGWIGETFFGLAFHEGAMLGAGIALVYTVLGGLLADAVTDTVQFTVMCVTVAIAAIYALGDNAGPSGLEASGRLPPETFEPFGGLSLAEICVYGSVALTPLVEPAFYQRTFAAKGSRAIIKALVIGVGLWIAYDWLVVYLGITAQDLVARGELDAEGMESGAIMLRAMQELLPTGLLGLFLAGCLASAMSTLDSYALIAAGNLVYDGWEGVTGRKLEDRTLLWTTRLLTVLTTAGCVWVALQFESMRGAWIFMATVLLSTAFVPMLAALFFLRARRPLAGTLSAWTGLVASLSSTIAFFAWGTEVDGEVSMEVLGRTWIREQAVLVAVPLSIGAFAAGYTLDRLRENRS